MKNSINIIISLALLMPIIASFKPNSISLDNSNQNISEFICIDGANGISAIDALEASGNHSIFLSLLAEYDEEAYNILDDPILADKTIWAPIDAAFDEVEDALADMDSEQIKIILGYHISPPLSRPNGNYPIITFDYMRENGTVTYRTRTGVLTGSDQRITSTYDEGIYKIESATILASAYCTQAGSVFSIDEVIMHVEHPSWLTKLGYQTIRILFYDDIRFVIYSTVGSTSIGIMTAYLISRKKQKEKKNETKI